MVRELGIGGCERDLTRAALGLDRSLFEPHVACFCPEGPRGEELRQAGVPIVRLPVTSFRSLSALRGARQMGEYLRRHKIKLVHTFDVPMTVFGVPVARVFRTPVVIASQLASRSFCAPASRRLLRLTDRMVDAVVVNCQALARHMIEDEKVSAGLIHLCYNGVDPGVFYPAEEPRPAVLADASPVVGTVCALRPEKRVDLLLEAFARVRRLDSRMKLLVVGGGLLLKDLELQRDRLGLKSACAFEETTRTVAPWMRGIDIFVLASSLEGFPNALLEALASGCCAVASRVGGIPEMVTHMQDGLLFEPGNVEDLAGCLSQLIRDRQLRRRLAVAGVRRAREKFSVEIFLERIQTLYLKLLRAKSSR